MFNLYIKLSKIIIAVLKYNKSLFIKAKGISKLKFFVALLITNVLYVSFYLPDLADSNETSHLQQSINLNWMHAIKDRQDEDFVSFDTQVNWFMQKYGIKGASIAIAKDNKIVYQKGFGYADASKNIPVLPMHQFRIASISKLITAAAIMKLQEQGLLKLDQPVFGEYGILKHYQQFCDPAYKLVTIRHLLTHRAGWSSWESDPMFMPTHVARRMGVAAPAQDTDIIDFVLKHRKLRYAVGGKYAYSNIGYVILAKVIEELAGQPYEEFVKIQLFDPTGIKQVELGNSLRKDKSTWEVDYHNYQGAAKVEAYDGSGQMVDKPNGGNYLEAMHGAGGWIASAPDLLRFVLSIDGDETLKDVISKESAALMMAEDKGWSHALGWSGAIGGNAWRSGTLAGTSAYTYRGADGLTWVVLMNSSVWNGHHFTKKIRYMMQAALKKVNHWPDHDFNHHIPLPERFLPLASF